MVVATQAFFEFSSLRLGEMIQFDYIKFFKWVGKKHQLVLVCPWQGASGRTSEWGEMFHEWSNRPLDIL